MYKVSFVVDGSSLHYYQAELLLFSLEQFANQPKEDILIHCTTKVEATFIDFLKQKGYTYKIVEPFLDGKWCNKLQQLASFSEFKDKEGGVFFLDADMFVLQPLTVPNPTKFSAKIVDGPNPPLQSLQKIYTKAGVTFPAPTESDWIQNNSATAPTNFNGGMYNIPFNLLSKVDTTWKKWATWLYEKPELFERKEQVMHTDQVSMALTVSELALDYHSLSANYNFPLASQNEIRSFEKNQPISILHYHKGLSPFGVLEDNDFLKETLGDTLAKVNKLICTKFDFIFYSAFKKASILPIDYTQRSKAFENGIQKITSKWNKKIKLILHAGTPKTGTTSIQFFLHGNRKDVLSKGILYPDVLSKTSAPKHQWIIDTLYANDPDALLGRLKLVAAEVKKDTHTIFLSTEGIFNHWFDFTQEAKSCIAILSKYFDLHCWICYRKPTSFFSSFYKQNLKNPQLPDVKCYGRDMSLMDMMQDQWFRRHLDYLGFVYDMESLMPKENVKIFPYNNDIIDSFANSLGIKFNNTKDTRENTGLCNTSIEVLRIINRDEISIEQKKKYLDMVISLEKALATLPQREIDNTEANNFINELSAQTMKALEKEYGVVLKY